MLPPFSADASVDVAVEWVLISVFVVLVAGLFDPLRLHTIGHQEQVTNVFPVDPFREQRLDCVDPVAELPVNHDDILVRVRPGFIDIYAVL